MPTRPRLAGPNLPAGYHGRDTYTAARCALQAAVRNQTDLAELVAAQNRPAQTPKPPVRAKVRAAAGVEATA